MTPKRFPAGIARLSTWVSREHWTERIVSFNASWFVASMGTGVIVEVLTNFPYPAQWLTDLAYCFWILAIILFLFFTTLGVIRSFQYPDLTRSIVQDFYQTSFLGAIPVTLDTIIAGIIVFYSDRMSAVWAAFGLYWVSVAMSLIVGGIIVFITCAYQEAPELSSVTGVWLLSFIPFLVTSATGSLIVPHLPMEDRGFTLIVSFFLWSLGVTMSMFILVVYFWRLIRHKLPVRDAIVSCFIPMGPTAMGAYSIHNLSLVLSTYIISSNSTLLPPSATTSPQISIATATAAIATSVHWLGLITALLLTSFSTFWLLQSTLAVLARVPARFNVGFWSFVFPNAVYSNALALLAKDLDSRGFRGWAATMGTATVLLWCLCAAGTVWKGVWCGELFFAPGLEGWNERRALGLEGEGGADGVTAAEDGRPSQRRGSGARRETSARSRSEGALAATDLEAVAGAEADASPSVDWPSGLSAGDAEMLGADYFVTTERTSRPDGTYALTKSRRRWKRTWSLGRRSSSKSKSRSEGSSSSSAEKSTG